MTETCRKYYINYQDAVLGQHRRISKCHVKQKKWGRELCGYIYIKLKNQAKLKHKVKDSGYL